MILLLLACTTPPAESGETGGDTGGGDPCVALGDDDPCCREWTETLWACPEGLATAVETAGSFTTGSSTAESSTWTFRTDVGEDLEVFFYGSEAGVGLLPDLAALGPVVLWYDGGCGSDGEGSEAGTFVVLGVDGALRLAVGSYREGQADGLTVSAGDPESCPARPSEGGCFARVRNAARVFTVGAESATLRQGESAIVGGLTVHLLGAMTAESESTCDDVGGNLENWVAVGP